MKMSKARDIAYGLHSNIPMCCIKFYVDQWDWRDDATHARAINASVPAWQYVPCHECLRTNNHAHLRMCEAECGKQCWKDFK